jgi:hypothetical protein
LDINKEEGAMPENNSLKRAVRMTGLSLITLFSFIAHVHGESLETLGVNPAIGYDIYVGGEEKEAVVIRDVDLLRIAEIANTSFLVIERHGFNLKQHEGFIRLDKVLAILPNNKIDVDKINHIEIK